MVGVHPPGRRRLRSAVRADGYESWTIELEQFEALRELRFTNWVRFVKVDLECEGALQRVARSSPQRVRLAEVSGT